MSFEQTVLEKLDRIETKQLDHTVQLALNTKVLDEHHRRTTNLEVRIEPVEDHLKFLLKLTKLATTVFALVGAVAAVLKLLL